MLLCGCGGFWENLETCNDKRDLYFKEDFFVFVLKVFLGRMFGPYRLGASSKMNKISRDDKDASLADYFRSLGTPQFQSAFVPIA